MANRLFQSLLITSTLAFSLVAIALGLYLINGLGPQFGRGPAEGRVDRRAALGMTLALLIVVLSEVTLANW